MNDKLKLSVIVISYNMSRELPRTLRTLSAHMQQGIDARDYEIIVVDNGSLTPVNQTYCKSIAPNTTFLDETTSSRSPAAAINYGLAHARGDLIGVMIDGARMASPGLLRCAIDAGKLHSNAVIGSLAFHLGESMQMNSVKTGYNQEVEDRLLDTVPWKEDGYKLFDISVFAGSSDKGWFVVPAETNAMFMRKHIWKELGGYSLQFQSAGGGLVNHDTWKRVCALDHAQVVMLLGEGTFHQFHGGIATNAIECRYDQFHQEYVSIRGQAYKAPMVRNVRFYGSFKENHRKSLLQSANKMPQPQP